MKHQADSADMPIKSVKEAMNHSLIKFDYKARCCSNTVISFACNLAVWRGVDIDI